MRGAGSKEGEVLNSNEGDQNQGVVMKKAEVVREEGRADVEVQAFFAEPPWLRYSRLESGSWMGSAYCKMHDEGRKDEDENKIMESESWHKG